MALASKSAINGALCLRPATVFGGKPQRKQTPTQTSLACRATKKIALLPGDGIGPEITDATVKVLKVS